MKLSVLQRRSLVLLILVVPLLVLFVYVALRSGPLAPVAVTVITAQAREISPALFGVGTVEARYSYRIGSTSAGRVKWLEVQVGDRVKQGHPLVRHHPGQAVCRTRLLRSVILICITSHSSKKTVISSCAGKVSLLQEWRISRTFERKVA